MLKQLKSLFKKQNPEENEYYLLGHMIKYNLYLLSKAIVFSAISEKNPKSSLSEIAESTNKTMTELDLSNKK